MDPVTLTVAALTAGASAALKNTVEQAVKDAYSGLKALLKRKLVDKPFAEEVMIRHEKAPEAWEKPLDDELRKADIASDEDVIRAAQRLLELVDPSGAQGGKYNVTITGGKQIVVGDNANVTMNVSDD